MDIEKLISPPTSIMVNNAIKNLKARGGSSIQAIKTYLTNTYKVDTQRLAPFIKRYLNSAVAAGVLMKTKPQGAFKIPKPKKLITAKKPTDGIKNKPLSPKKKIIKPKSPTNKAKTKKIIKKKSILKAKGEDKKKFNLVENNKSINITVSPLKTPKKKIVPKKSSSPTTMMKAKGAPKQKPAQKTVSNIVKGTLKKLVPKKKR